jgi:hypothetical protein
MSVTRAAAAARRTSVPSPTPPRRWLTIPAGLAACCARKLKLSDAQLRVVYRRFCSVDADRSGQISAKEFFTLIGAVDTPFVRVLIDRMVFDWADLNVCAARSSLSSRTSPSAVAFAVRRFYIGARALVCLWCSAGSVSTCARPPLP